LTKNISSKKQYLSKTVAFKKRNLKEKLLMIKSAAGTDKTYYKTNSKWIKINKE
jgi:hypothetical protein